jgi:hypothetical protein
MTFGEQIEHRDDPGLKLIARNFDYSAVIWCGTSQGSSNDYDLVPSVPINSYKDGTRFVFLADKTCSGAVTASVIGPTGAQLTTKDVVKNVSSLALVSGDIKINTVVTLMYVQSIDALLLLSVAGGGAWWAAAGGKLITGISVPANTLNQAQAHGLGSTPSLWWTVLEQGGKVEHGTTAMSSTNIYLSNRGTTAATVSVLVFP